MKNTKIGIIFIFAVFCLVAAGCENPAAQLYNDPAMQQTVSRGDISTAKVSFNSITRITELKEGKTGEKTILLDYYIFEDEELDNELLKGCPIESDDYGEFVMVPVGSREEPDGYEYIEAKLDHWIGQKAADGIPVYKIGNGSGALYTIEETGEYFQLDNGYKYAETLYGHAENEQVAEGTPLEFIAGKPYARVGNGVYKQIEKYKYREQYKQHDLGIILVEVWTDMPCESTAKVH